MSAYEQKLDDFAKGKTFRRLSQPIRDQADTFCDACGSNQPRMLYGLKEKQSDRYFFVGANCLTELLKRCAVQRRYSKESARAAYDDEMESRAQDSSGVSPLEGDNTMELGTEGTQSLPLYSDVRDPTPIDWQFIPTILIHEVGGHYRVLVSLVSRQGTPYASGCVEGVSDYEISHMQQDGGVLLQQTKVINSPALADSISKAWIQAIAQMSLVSEVPQGLQDLAPLSISGINNNLVNGRIKRDHAGS